MASANAEAIIQKFGATGFEHQTPVLSQQQNTSPKNNVVQRAVQLAADAQFRVVLDNWHKVPAAIRGATVAVIEAVTRHNGMEQSPRAKRDYKSSTGGEI